MISPEEAKSKVSAGWIRVWAAFEALAIDSEVVKKALNDMVERIDGDGQVKVYKKEFLEAKKLEIPVKNIKEGFTQVVNVEFVAKDFVELVQFIIEYGPSAIEVHEPSKINLPVGDAQDVLNNIAGMMHRYAAAGIGGAVVLRTKE